MPWNQNPSSGATESWIAWYSAPVRLPDICAARVAGGAAHFRASGSHGFDPCPHANPPHARTGGDGVPGGDGVRTGEGVGDRGSGGGWGEGVGGGAGGAGPDPEQSRRFGHPERGPHSAPGFRRVRFLSTEKCVIGVPVGASDALIEVDVAAQETGLRSAVARRDDDAVAASG
eukprot:gene4550-biopygen11725